MYLCKCMLKGKLTISFSKDEDDTLIMKVALGGFYRLHLLVIRFCSSLNMNYTIAQNALNHLYCADFSQTEHGLGLSETFYAWTIAAFSIGEFVGALSAGILTNIIPFWHNVLIGILAHTFGYLLYALATEGWMMIISRLLTGTFVGMQSVTAFTYFGVSYEKYLQALGEGRKEEEGKTVRVKDTLFVLFALSSNMGHLIGPGWYIICFIYYYQHVFKL